VRPRKTIAAQAAGGAKENGTLVAVLSSRVPFRVSGSNLLFDDERESGAMCLCIERLVADRCHCNLLTSIAADRALLFSRYPDANVTPLFGGDPEPHA
jgi:hypothetical protein